MAVKDISEPMFTGRNTYTGLELNVPDDPRAVDCITDEPVCPAALPFMHEASYPSCVCRVDGTEIKQKLNPNSYRKWCAGDHQACPVWRMARDRELAAKR